MYDVSYSRNFQLKKISLNILGDEIKNAENFNLSKIFEVLSYTMQLKVPFHSAFRLPFSLYYSLTLSPYYLLLLFLLLHPHPPPGPEGHS